MEVNRVTEALNEASILGFGNADNAMLHNVITEYFGQECRSDDDESDLEESSDEEWSDMDTNETDSENDELNPDHDHVEADADDGEPGPELPPVIENLADELLEAVGVDPWRINDDPDEQLQVIEQWECM